jgi:hypothetical protein
VKLCKYGSGEFIKSRDKAMARLYDLRILEVFSCDCWIGRSTRSIRKVSDKILCCHR